MTRSLQLKQYQISLYQNSPTPAPVIWLHSFPGEGDHIWDACGKNFHLLCVTGMDWNRDFSPWPADRAFSSGEDFQGGAEDYLDLFLKYIIPQGEAMLSFPVTDRGIAGYSMAGLFAVYAMYHTGIFHRIGAVSASLWFDGWKEYCLEHTPLSRPVMYVSLGNKEHKIRNERMASVKNCTEKLVSHWRRSLTVQYEINQGGHFDHPEMRTAKGIDALTLCRLFTC